MHIDDKITVTCTDTEKSLPGTVMRLRGDWIDIAVSDFVLSLRRTKPGLWVGTSGGMEFVVRSPA